VVWIGPICERLLVSMASHNQWLDCVDKVQVAPRAHHYFYQSRMVENSASQALLPPAREVRLALPGGTVRQTRREHK